MGSFGGLGLKVGKCQVLCMAPCASHSSLPIQGPSCARNTVVVLSVLSGHPTRDPCFVEPPNEATNYRTEVAKGGLCRSLQYLTCYVTPGTPICMYACMHACMHVCMYVCVYVCMHVCMHVYYTSIYIILYTCFYVYVALL